MLLGTLRASLLGNLLSGKGLARAGEGTTRAGKGLTRAGEGITCAGNGVKKNPKIYLDAISSANKY